MFYFPNHFFVHYIQQKIKTNLSYDTVFAEIDTVQPISKFNFNCLQDQSLIDRFMNIGIHKSFHAASQYLHVGISQYCDHFLDWSLLKFAAEVFNTENALSLCTQLLCFFQESLLC